MRVRARARVRVRVGARARARSRVRARVRVSGSRDGEHLYHLFTCMHVHIAAQNASGCRADA